jgi:hypothetical protein
MNKNQRRELEAILNAAASRSRPALNYAVLSAGKFVILWTYMIAVEDFSKQLVAVCGGRVRGGQLSNGKFNEIMNRAETPLTRAKILGLGEWFFEPRLFGILAECMYEFPYGVGELERRLEDHQIAKDLIIVPLTTGLEVGRARAEKLLKVDSIPTYSPRDYATDDLKQEVFQAVLETIEEDATIDHVPLPSFPLPLALGPEIKRIIDWETDIAEVWRRDEERRRKIKAGLESTDEVLKEKARESLRDLWATIKRRKTIFDRQRDDIKSKTFGNISTPEDSLMDREEGIRAYDYVKARRGEQGRIYLDTLIATGGNVAVASKAAGVSRVTGNNWRRELQIQLSRKNLAQ